MKCRILIIVLTGFFLFGLSIRPSLFGQTCQDDEGMVRSYVQSITDLASTVKKESLADFEKDYHKQSCLTRLTLSLGMIDSLISCLNKEAKTATATREQIATINSKLQNYTKLKSELEQDRDALKAAKDAKTAKSVIAKFAISA